LKPLDRYFELENGDFAVDLFPYKVKNRNLFYNREHPKDVHPDSFLYQNYWDEQIKNYIDGRWINDEGTWVYMMPKLDFYINYVTIPDEDRVVIKPRLRDNEWLQATYYLYSDGFSGFEDDEEITCSYIVDKVERGLELTLPEKKYLKETPNIHKKDGSYKKYVHPWEYLTETYLITNKKDKPLGHPIYENPKKDTMIMSARGVAKSFFGFGCEFLHEWLFNGARRVEELPSRVNARRLFGLGSGDARQINRSLEQISGFYEKMPGGYLFGVGKDGKPDELKGALYKNIQGNWKTGSTVLHVLSNMDNTDELKGNMCQVAALTSDKYNVFAGDRFAQIWVEEVGFCPYIKDVRSSVRDSLRVGNNKIGKFCMLGTGGDMIAVKEPKDMFENPIGYDIADIPNYFEKNKQTRIGLFIPAYYQAESLKDENGNTIIKEALLDVVQKRIKEKSNSDSRSFGSYVMYNPIYPKEMLRPNKKSELPTVELSEHRANITNVSIKDGSSIFKRRARIGAFHTAVSPSTDNVVFKNDLEGVLEPILSWGRDSELSNKEGAWIMYEDVMTERPKNLYWILLDPAAQSGDGTSLFSVLIYKHYFQGGLQKASMKDAIVGEWIGRYSILDNNFKEVIKAAKYYNARILNERNTPGFYEYCEREGFLSMLQDEPWGIINDIRKTQSTSRRANKGIRTDKSINDWSLIKLANWLMKPVLKDEDDMVLKYNYHNIFSPRLLDELINYDHERKTEFDHVSSLMLLMPLLADLEDAPTTIVDEEEDMDKYYEEKYGKFTSQLTERRLPEFLNY